MKKNFRAHVIMTDLEKTLPMLKENVEINRKYWESLKGYCEIQQLDWGNKIDLDYKPAIVLLTDCVYYKDVILYLSYNFLNLTKYLFFSQ